MSSFYEDASLVMIPSGYKTSKVYSAKPTTGSGDLSFTRSNDTATRVNSAGLIEKVRTNLILQSQAFNTTWTSISASVTANTTANPLNGAVDADTITLTGATTQKYVTQSFSLNGNYTASVYLKAGTHQFAQIMLGTDTAPIANFDLTNGTSSATNSTAKIVSVGGGWYRCSMSFTSTTGTTVFILAVDSLAASRFATTASTGTLIAFGYQLETGDIATDYIPTTSAAVSVGPVANVPRLDYLNSSCPRLLLEPQRTNLITYSEQFNNAAWDNAGGAVVSANTAVAPDGTTSADTATFGAGSAILRQITTSLTPSVSYTFTAYVKKSATSGANNVRLTINNTVSWSGAGSTKITLTNSWQRVSLTRTSDVNAYLIIGSLDQNGNPDTSCYGNVDIWGAQFEQGAYATSYIPTLGSASTRGADTASKTGISSLIGQTEGAFMIDVNLDSRAQFTYFAIAPDITSAANYIGIGLNLSSIIFECVSSSTLQAAITLNNSSTGRFKIAAAYKANDFVLYVNGTQVGTDTSGSVPTCSQLGLYQYNQTPSVKYNQTLLFKTRLSNSDLADLTAL